MKVIPKAVEPSPSDELTVEQYLNKQYELIIEVYYIAVYAMIHELHYLVDGCGNIRLDDNLCVSYLFLFFKCRILKRTLPNLSESYDKNMWKVHSLFVSY